MPDNDLQILRLIDEGTAAETGASFFRELVERLALALDSQYAFVSRFCDDNTRVHVLALWTGSKIQENFDYPLAGSPCEHVLGGDIVAFNSGIQDLFPAEREALKEMGAESYLAIPLKNRQGDVLGHLAVIDVKPKNWQERDFGILRIFAARCTAEIERQLAEQEMAQANVELARRVQLEALVAETSTRFMSIDSALIDAEIIRALGAMGRFINSDRGVMFLFDADRNAARLSHEWSLQETQQVRSRVPVLSREDVPEVLDYFLAKSSVNASRPELLPSGFDKLDRLLGTKEVMSRIAVPLVFANETIGLLGYHSLGVERRWPPEDLRLLRLLSEIIAGALMRRRTEESLERARDAAEIANRAKSEFLATMSHELRTPLNGILGYAQLLRRDPQLLPDHAESIQAIENCGQHLLTLIGEVLDLAKIEAGRMEIEPRPVPLDELLREVSDIARIRASQANLRFLYETVSALPSAVITDGRKLRQVLLNLMGNAVKFTDKGGVSFRIASLPAQDGKVHLRFDIEDTGIGIAAEEIERVFDPFHQVRHAHRTIEGTGLGLAISRKLVALLGGTLCVTSEVGRGSTFTVELTVSVASDVPIRNIGSTGTVLGYNGPRRRILVADDKSDNRQILSRLLKSLGFSVDEAVNGAIAVQLANTLQPNLIFMDLVMPVKDGFEAIRELRESTNPRVTDIPIVAVSASAFDDTRSHCTAAGCDDFIAKPIRLDEVIEVVGRLLKLEWTRGPARSRPAERSASNSERLRTAKVPQPIAKDLYELALMGDVQSLQLRLIDLRRQASVQDDVIDELVNMVGRFDTKALREFLRPHADATSEVAHGGE